MASAPGIVRGPVDEARAPYRLLLVTGVIAALLLLAGALEFFHFEPPFQHTGLHARIQGIYTYDARSGQVGSKIDHIEAGKAFAAVVDWSSLPSQLQVGGRWFVGGFALDAGGVGPAPAGSLPSTIPIATKQKLPAGQYLFAVERWSGGRAVEVLGRASIEVAGT
jgi:hypothetical protein